MEKRKKKRKIMEKKWKNNTEKLKKSERKQKKYEKKAKKQKIHLKLSHNFLKFSACENCCCTVMDEIMGASWTVILWPLGFGVFCLGSLSSIAAAVGAVDVNDSKDFKL